MSVSIIDENKAEAFAEKIVDTLNQGSTALMVSIGHRTGLFDTMSTVSFSNSDEIARVSGLNERYIREWLGAMVTAGVVEHRPEDNSFRLPPEHAACLTRSSAPNNIAAFTQYIGVLGSVENEVVDAFTHGRGVPYSAYERFHSVMAEDSGQTVVAALLDHILPLVPGLPKKLDEGIQVLDVGCGSGRALILLAENFPESHFTGFDISQEAITAAEEEAQRINLRNVDFQVRDVAEAFPQNRYDLVTAFDAIHDQATPQVVLNNIYNSLAPGALFLMQDIAASRDIQNNIDHPIGPFLYTISCMHCMSVSLANGGPGLGAMWGRETAIEMLEEAGFQDVSVKQLSHDIQNYFYIVKKKK